MRKKIGRASFILILSIGIISTAMAQTPTGSIRGKITTSEGLPLSGAQVYLSSPALMGIQTYITSESGYIKFTYLPPGRYKIIAEKPEFKSVIIENIAVWVGKTSIVKITLDQSVTEEEVTVSKAPSGFDIFSTKTAVNIDKELLKNIPLARDLSDIVNSNPGVIPEGISDRRTSTGHGSSVRANTYILDGMNITDPLEMYPSTNINFDLIEEVELETAARPAEIGFTEGTYINILTKSGGNEVEGNLLLYHTSEGLSKSLWSEEEINSSEVSPVMDKKLWDASFSLGGPILEDFGWFFGNFRFISQSRQTPFSSWTDPLGKSHEEYDWNNREILGFFKLSALIASKIRFSGTISLVDRYRRIFEFSPAWNLTEEASHTLDHEKNLMGSAVLHYLLNQNASIDIKAGFINHKLPLRLKEEATGNPQYWDESTGFQWGSARLNETSIRKRFNVGGYLTLFMDTSKIGNHEFKLGGEYETVEAEWSTWKEDNLSIHYYEGSPYFYGFAPSPTSGNSVGKGKIRFYITSMIEEGLIQKDELRRFGVFIQDSASIADRLTLNLGLRFNLSTARKLTLTKAESGNPVSVQVGEELIEPLIGLNPFGENVIPEWRDLLSWAALSPRVGLTFDVLGNRKTIFKASFARYAEYLTPRYTSSLGPFLPIRSHQLIWYDENADGKVDGDDTYSLLPEDYRLYLEEYYTKRIAEDVKPPHTDELVIGLHQELLKELSIQVNYISKSKKNFFGNVLFAPDLGMDWYTLEQDTEGWWIPFNTIIPGGSDYPDTPLTAYFRSNDAPLAFDQAKNVPELKRKYRALEFIFQKHMSNNWQLFGSVVFSKATGNIGLDYISSSGFSMAGRGPNYFINLPEDSRVDLDRPFVLKLMATYKFPYGFFLSFYYTRMSGAPWARSITIIPPSSWALDNNASSEPVMVFLEEPGSRREEAFNNLDLRLEKEFRLGSSGRLGAYVDVLNILGNKRRFISENDGGFWFPEEEDSTGGLRVLSPTYQKTTLLSGSRIFKISLRLSF